MSGLLDFLLELLKLTIPGLVVFFTAWYLIREFLDKQIRLKQVEINQQARKVTLPIKLQAYERLALLMERIQLPNLVWRIRAEGTNAAALRIALLMAIQQEFEHNATQQVYVSENLWQIVKLARQEVEQIINGVAEKVDPKADSKVLADALVVFFEKLEEPATAKALNAIRKEAAVFL